MRITDIITENNKLTLRDFVITVGPHSLDRCGKRGVNPYSVDNILKNISQVKHSIMGIEPGASFILHNGRGTGLGMRRHNGNNLTLATVFNTQDNFSKGKHPTFLVKTQGLSNA